MSRPLGQAMSDLEDELEFQLKAAKIPYEREVRFHPKRRWRFDFIVQDTKIAVEVEGGIWGMGRHTRGAGFEADAEKSNEATILGWKLLRVTPKHIRSGQALEWIESLREKERK